MEESFKELEKKLTRYKWYLKESKIIELSIRYPIRENDENIGGGSRNTRDNDNNLRTLIKLEENEDLSEYIEIGKAIEKTYAELPDYKKEAMMEFYINRKNHPYRGHPKRVAAKLNIDVKTLYRWRMDIVDEFKENLKK